MSITVVKHRFALLLLGFLLATAPLSRAQWLSQSITLVPGWNAVYLQVDASYTNLDTLLPDAQGPIAQIWQWNPTFSVQQYTTTPANPHNDGSQWTSWTSARGDNDTLTLLGGNNALLIYNKTASDYVWSVKGRPRPPNYQWTTTGLNFFGYPTPAGAAPSFATYYAPVPAVQGQNPLDPQNFGTSVHVFHYPGGALATDTPTPVEITSAQAASTLVKRGEAFWVQGPTNYYNLYYGPVQVSLQNPAGVSYGNNLGEYSLFLNNLTASNRTITLRLVSSEPVPAGQKPIAGAPELLVRGALSSITLDYAYTPLDAGGAGSSFTLAPAGQVGSQLTVVLGLNRVLMTQPSGSLYAAVLRLTDTNGLQQVDLPVSATVSSTAGLWVGNASITGVSQYLKAYPEVDTSSTNQAAQIDAATTAAGKPANNSVTANTWSATQANSRVPTVANFSFEANKITNGVGYGTITSWATSSASTSGLNPVQGVNNFTDNGRIPDGGQVAFMQGFSGQGDGTLSQTLSNFTVNGSYQLHYYENARNTPIEGAPNLDASWPIPPTRHSSWPVAPYAYVSSNSASGWQVRVVVADTADPSVANITSIQLTEDLLAHPSKQFKAGNMYGDAAGTAVGIVTTSPVINFVNSGAGGHFTASPYLDAPFPGLNAAKDNFALEATGYLTIPTAGNWSFGVNSDDGFQLVVGGRTNIFNGGRGPGDTIATFNLAAGTYPIRLVYFEAGGGAEVEVYAASGSYASWDATVNWALVGDTAHGGLAVSPPVSWGYPNSSVTLGGATLVAKHPVTPVGGTNAYHEIVSAPFVASSSSLNLAFNKFSPAIDTTAVPLYSLAGGSSNWTVITPYPFPGGSWTYTNGQWQAGGQTNTTTSGSLSSQILAGTIIGTPYSAGDANPLSNAFDGNPGTAFAGLYGSGEWVGLDFGQGASHQITSLGYTPRGGVASRMLNGTFQGANNYDFSDAVGLYTITNVPPDGGTTVTLPTTSSPRGFRYFRYFGATNTACDVAELQFYGQPMLTNYDSYLTTQSFTNTKYGQLEFTLKHRWSFGTNNGGQVQLSVNGSPFQQIAGVGGTGPQYNAFLPNIIVANYTTALRNLYVWNGTNASGPQSYETSVMTLGYFNAGDVLQLRLHEACGTLRDQLVANRPAWEVSSLVVTNKGNPPPDTTLLVDKVSVTSATLAHYYAALAGSVSGQILVAAEAGTANARNGSIYVSANYGQTWTASGPTNSWSAAACSQDGRVLLVGAYNGPLYLSTDSGSTWRVTSAPSQQWSGLAASSDGSILAAVGLGGLLYVSTDGGLNWTSRAVQPGGGAQNFTAIAMSAAGSNLVAAVEGGSLYCSADSGLNWAARASQQEWSAVASSADGNHLVATVRNGFIYVSADAGQTWNAKAFSAGWAAVASSTDGLRLTAAANQIYTSVDSGTTWTTNAVDGASHSFTGVSSSGDGGLVTAVTGDGTVGNGSIFVLARSFASYTVNADNGLVEDSTGAYLTSGVNTNNAGVASAMPLRLILHNRGDGHVTLLQRVYVGADVNTNTVVANRQSLLDPAQLASARRISAVHLPFATNNPVWTASGNVLPGSVVNFTLFLSYKDQASNPFLHTFHPDHDNLQTDFQHLQPRGLESYDISRNLLLSFTPPGTNYGSLTAAAQTAAGYYQETMNIGGLGAASRDFRFNGTFSLQQISTVTNLLINTQ